MNALHRLVVVIALFSLTSVQTAWAGHETSGGRPAPLAFGVQFTSSGSGIDGASYAGVLAFIGKGVGEGSLTKVLNKKWGREGESSICLEFTDTNTSSNALLEVQKIIRDTRNPSKPKPTTTGLLSCDDTTFGPFRGDDRSLEVYGDPRQQPTPPKTSSGMSGCITLSVQVALDTYAQSHVLYPIPTIEVAQSTGAPSNGIDIMVTIDGKTTYYVIATPDGHQGCVSATVTSAVSGN